MKVATFSLGASRDIFQKSHLRILTNKLVHEHEHGAFGELSWKDNWISCTFDSLKIIDDCDTGADCDCLRCLQMGYSERWLLFETKHCTSKAVFSCRQHWWLIHEQVPSKRVLPEPFQQISQREVSLDLLYNILP